MSLQYCTCEICGKSFLFGVDENGELIGYHRQLCSSFCNGVASGKKALAASLNSREEELERLKAEVDDLKAWKQSAIAVLHAWDAAWIAAGKPGRLGESMAATTTQEIHRLKAENAELKKKLDLREEYDRTATEMRAELERLRSIIKDCFGADRGC